MTDSVAARRYARALFDMGRETGTKMLEQWGGEIANIAALTAQSSDLARLFSDPVFSPEEKKNVIAVLAKKLSLSASVRNFCFLLADKSRLMLLPSIAGQYQALVDTEKGVLRGEFISAVPLDTAKQSAVLEQLAKKAGGKPLALNFSVDKTLLGGMVIKVGDNVMDASLKTQLIILKDTIKRGE